MTKDYIYMIGKKNILKYLKNTYCRLQPSKIQGVGVFAVRDIPPKTNPFKVIKQQKWLRFTVEELKNLDKEILHLIDDFFVIHDGVVDISELGLNGMDISYFLNNAKKPNMKTVDDGSNFVTLRKIRQGEELTVSYATYDKKYKKQ